jgi:hypothetical protein
MPAWPGVDVLLRRKGVQVAVGLCLVSAESVGDSFLDLPKLSGVDWCLKVCEADTDAVHTVLVRSGTDCLSGACMVTGRVSPCVGPGLH